MPVFWAKSGFEVRYNSPVKRTHFQANILFQAHQRRYTIEGEHQLWGFLTSFALKSLTS